MLDGRSHQSSGRQHHGCPRPPRSRSVCHWRPSKLKRRLKIFWRVQKEVIQTTVDFRETAFSLRKIKKFMKGSTASDVAKEAKVLMSKALEMFIAELVVHAAEGLESKQRTTLFSEDIEVVVPSTQHFKFLDSPVIQKIIRKKAEKESSKKKIADLQTDMRNAMWSLRDTDSDSDSDAAAAAAAPAASPAPATADGHADTDPDAITI